MAKNAVKKKQRIAHNKTLNSEHEMDLCPDVLSIIMEEMNNNNLEDTYLRPERSKTNGIKMQNTKTPNHIPNYVSVPKSRKFGVSQKFPLMEKTQRTLKQLRHNRKIPKPRAHLALLSNEPIFKIIPKSVEKLKKNKIIMQNSVKSQNTVIEKVANDRLFSNKNKIKKNVIDKEIPKRLEPLVLKNSSIEESTSVSKKSKSALVKTNYSVKDSSNLMNNSRKTESSASDSDDYEKFIQKEKKSLPKKSKNQTCKKPSKSSKKEIVRTVSKSSDSDMTDDETFAPLRRRSKRKNRLSTTSKDHDDESKYQKGSRKSNSKSLSKFTSSESDSELSDDTTSISSKSKRGKRMKISNEVLNKQSVTKGDSESEMDINDEPHHNSSSESDDLPSPSSLGCFSFNTNKCDSQLPDQNCDEDKSVSQFTLSPKMSDISSNADKDIPNAFQNKNPSCKTSDIVSFMSNDYPLHCKTIDSGYKQANVFIQSNNHSLKVNDQSNSKCASEKNVSLSESSKTNSNQSLTVDLTESDNECENSFTIMPKVCTTSSQNNTNLQGDDSDIELIDVIILDLPKDASSSKKHVPNFSSGNNNEMNIKTEKVDQTHPGVTVKPQNILSPNLELKACKYEIPYTTGICQNYEKSELKNDILTSPNSFITNKVKEEPSNDDCEIILDTTSVSNSTVNLASVHSINIKTERESKPITSVPIAGDGSSDMKSSNKLIIKEEKAFSNLKTLNISHNKDSLEEMPNLNSMKMKKIIDELKKEIATYQEIIHTEESVEATFKLLEKCQAEKLVSLRLQLSKCLNGTINIGDSCNSLKEMNELLDKSELSRSLKDCPSANIPTPDISMQDLKTLATMNLVPLSSISENDVKPNLAELQCALKQESCAPDEAKLYAEKCIVCSKDAIAACQQCAKVFFCSNECGRKYWEDGHKDACIC